MRSPPTTTTSTSPMSRVATRRRLRDAIAARGVLTRRLSEIDDLIARLRAKIRRPRPRPQTVDYAISADGLDLVADFEGFFSHPYDDPSGTPNCTIGYGTLLHYGRCTAADKRKWRGGISEPEARRMLRKEIDEAIAVIRDSIQVALSQNQVDALASFVYNVGAGAFLGSTLKRRLDAGDFASVGPEFERWVYAGGTKLPGLVRRRKAERALFDRPVKRKESK